MLFSVKKFSITTTIAIILTLLACGQRVENPLDNPGSGIYTAGGGLVSIDIGDGLITKESPVTPLSDTFQVVLTKQPTADVTISTIISSNTGEVVVSTASLTFTTSNWDLPQFVTVTGVDDLVLDGMQIVFIDLGNTSSIDPDWDNIDLGELVVNNLDDETPTTPEVLLLIGDGLITREHPTTPLSDSFNVVLNSAPAADVTINPIMSTDTGEVIVSTATLTFTTTNWDMPQSVTVTGVDDAAVDGMQAITVNMGNTSSTDPSWNSLAAGSVTVYNLDDESPPSPGVIVNAGSLLLVSEEGNTSAFEVVLKSQPTASVTINVSVSDPSEGTIQTPFVGTSGTITFTTANWNFPQTVTVAGVDDPDTDGTQTFSIILDPTSSADPNYNGTFDPPDVTCDNVDNESPGVTVNTGSSMLVSEDGYTSSFQIVLNSQPAADVDINLSISDISEGIIQTPFVGTSGTITFNATNWFMARTVTIAGIDDAITDGTQPFNVILDPTSSADPIYNDTFDPPDVSFTNIDNESPGVTVNAGSSMLVSENGDTSSFDIVLNTPPTANVTINVSVDDPLEGTIVAPFAGANGVITFNATNWNFPQTIIVSGVNDNVADGNQSFNVVLGATNSTDPNYNGIFDPPDVSFTNVDDDNVGITVNIGNGLITKEHPTTPLTDTFQVVLNSQPTANVTLNNIVSTDIGEVTVNPGTLTFTTANWNFAQTVTVTGVDDAAVDGIISVMIDLGTATSGDPNYDAFDPGDVTVFNIDDEAPFEVIIIPDASLVTTENGGAVKLKIVLSSQPTNNVTLSTIQSLDPTEGTVSPSSLIFTPTDWNTPHVITITGVNDGGPGDGDINYDIDLGTTTSADANWNGIDPGDITFTNKDFMYITDYIWNSTTLPGSFNSINATGTTITFTSVEYYNPPPPTYPPEDEGFAIVPIGFDFNFIGKYYSEITVYTNGYASFNPVIYVLNCYANDLLFILWPPDNFINILSPWWDDLIMDTGFVYYETSGTAPNRVFTIEWENARVVAADDTYTFQIKLHETINVIEFIYGNSSNIDGSGPPPADDTSASIGIKEDALMDPQNYYIEGKNGIVGNDASSASSYYGRMYTEFPGFDAVISFSPP